MAFLSLLSHLPLLSISFLVSQICVASVPSPVFYIFVEIIYINAFIVSLREASGESTIRCTNSFAIFTWRSVCIHFLIFFTSNKNAVIKPQEYFSSHLTGPLATSTYLLTLWNTLFSWILGYLFAFCLTSKVGVLPDLGFLGDVSHSYSIMYYISTLTSLLNYRLICSLDIFTWLFHIHTITCLKQPRVNAALYFLPASDMTYIPIYSIA